MNEGGSLLICNKCKQEVQEDSAFCNYCGATITNQSIEKTEIRKKDILKNKKILVFISAILVVVCSILLFFYFNNPIRSYQSEIMNNNYSSANELYSEKIKGNVKREKQIKSFLLDEIEDIDHSFMGQKITYDNAKDKLNSIKGTGLVTENVTTAIEKIEKVNTSRIAYKKAEAFQDEKNYSEAIKEYKNVITEDENYEAAQKQIESIEEIYKMDILKRAEESANSQDYDTSVSLLKEASVLIKDNSDITAKLAVYETKLAEKEAAERKELIKKAEKEQLVVVENSRIIEQSTEFKSLYPDMIQVMVKNNSNKTIKSMRVGSLGFDYNGYPLKVKIQFSLLNDDYEFVGIAEDVNIVAGETFGENQGWSLDEQHGISNVLSCVKEVTFYDGTFWENPYYQYWIEKYKEKPLN